MDKLTSCPLCGSKNFTPFPQLGLAPMVQHKIMPTVAVNAAIVTNYFSCQQCRVLFQNPRLTEDNLDLFYSKGYYRRSLNLTAKRIREDEKERALRDADIIKKHAKSIHSHLDIGCGQGYLLKSINAPLKVGVEIDNQRIPTGEIEVYPRIDQVPQNSFDLVTAIHVIEHLPDPKNLLKSMVKKVAKNGSLVIEVPSWKSPGGPLRLAHLFHFETDVLKLLCQEVGLKVVEVEFTPHLLMICKVV